MDVFNQFRYEVDTDGGGANVLKKDIAIKTKHSCGDLIKYGGQYYEIDGIFPPNYKLKRLDNKEHPHVTFTDKRIVTIPKKQQYLIFSYLRFMERYNKTIKRIRYKCGENREEFDYLKLDNIDEDMSIIKKCGLTNTLLNKLEEALRYSRDESLQLHNICINPYDFIREDYQLITFDRAEKICREFGLDIPFTIKCEKFPYDLIRMKNSFYIESPYFKYMFEKYCAKKGNVSDFVVIVEKSIIYKMIESIKYVTTPYLINLEKTMTDTIMTLFHDIAICVAEEEILKEMCRFEDIQRATKADGMYSLEPEQRVAVIDTILNKMNVITGFPGTGKSEIVKCILYVNSKLCSKSVNDNMVMSNVIGGHDGDGSDDGAGDSDCGDSDIEDSVNGVDMLRYVHPNNISILAPTGLAYLNIARNQAGDMYNSDLSGTCHRIVYNIFPKIRSCKTRFQQGKKCGCKEEEGGGACKFARHQINLLIIDEFSMVDIFLFRDILNMCRFFGCRLLLVGDDNQLQSIGPGAVLRNIILCGAFNVTKLTTIKRQSTGSLINNIKEMNYGLITPDDFTDDSIQLLHIGEFINSGAIMADAIVRLIYKNKLTIGNSIFLSYFKSDKFACNTPDLNNILQSIFNPIDLSTDSYIPSGDKFENKCKFIVGDRILRIENDYTGKIMRANGEQAYITGYDRVKEVVRIQYTTAEDREEKISIYELYENFVLAYCLTVHKSQGSQYDNVVIFIDKNQSIWDKTALYTAISRAKLRCFIVSCCSDFIKTQNNIRSMDKISLLLKESDVYEF